MNEVTAVPPFTGFVVNFNVTTVLHRDHHDEVMCLVLVVSDCTGGQLCIRELGLVFEMESGDFIVFRSRHFTHFNLHFVGRRISLVFHSDLHYRSWRENRNGWSRNGNFSCSYVDLSNGERVACPT